MYYEIISAGVKLQLQKNSVCVVTTSNYQERRRKAEVVLDSLSVASASLELESVWSLDISQGINFDPK